MTGGSTNWLPNQTPRGIGDGGDAVASNPVVIGSSGSSSNPRGAENPAGKALQGKFMWFTSKEGFGRAIACALALLFFMGSHAHARDVDFGILLDWLVENSDYRNPAPPSAVRSLTLEHAAEVARRNHADDDPLPLAITNCPSRIVYLAPEVALLGPVMLHELVHVQQCMNRRFITDACGAELEATAIETKYYVWLSDLFKAKRDLQERFLRYAAVLAAERPSTCKTHDAPDARAIAQSDEARLRVLLGWLANNSDYRDPVPPRAIRMLSPRLALQVARIRRLDKPPIASVSCSELAIYIAPNQSHHRNAMLHALVHIQQCAHKRFRRDLHGAELEATILTNEFEAWLTQ